MIYLNAITSTLSPFTKPWGNYLLEKIVENQAPHSISWFPQTVGWQVLITALLLLLANKIYQAYENYQRNAYRRSALAWLVQCQQANDIKMYKQLPALLRKTALNAFKRSEISQLNGKYWEQWLDKQCQQTSFVTTCPNALHQLAFMPTRSDAFKAEQYQKLIVQVTLWIKHHRRSDA